MDSEKEITRKIELYGELAKENKNVDVAALMMSAIEQSKRDEIEAKKKRWAYLISVGLPPFGLLMAVRYYFSGKTDGKRVALICVILTATALLIAWGLAGLLFSSVSPADLKQIQSVKPEDIKSLLQ